MTVNFLEILQRKTADYTREDKLALVASRVFRLAAPDNGSLVSMGEAAVEICQMILDSDSAGRSIDISLNSNRGGMFVMLMNSFFFANFTTRPIDDFYRRRFEFDPGVPYIYGQWINSDEDLTAFVKAVIEFVR